MPTTSTRGVIASAARFSPKRIVRRSSSAVSCGQRAGLGRVRREQAQLLGRAGAGQLLLRLDARAGGPAQFAEPLSIRISQPKSREKTRIGAGGDPRGGHRRAMAAFFGYQLAEEHRQQRGDDQRAARGATASWALAERRQSAGASRWASAGSAR